MSNFSLVSTHPKSRREDGRERCVQCEHRFECIRQILSKDKKIRFTCKEATR